MALKNNTVESKNSNLGNSNKAQEEEERLLIKRALEGDDEARSEIVFRNQRNVYNLGLRLTGNEDEAECVLQDTFLKVFEKLEDFRGASRLGTWIHRIAANTALMNMRNRKSKHFVRLEENQQEDDPDYDLGFIARSLDHDPLESALNEELRVQLEEAVSHLPRNLRTAFVLKDLEGLSMNEIAEQLGKTVSAIKADLHRARVKLRSELAEFVGEGSHG